MKPNYKDPQYINARFGKLTVRGVEPTTERTFWVCDCVCGKQVTLPASKVARGVIVSCGCASTRKKHHNARYNNGQLTSLYKCWVAMRSKCNNYFDKTYHLYGGRGITYCEAWEDYMKFHSWAVKHGCDPKSNGVVHLRRHNNEKDFTPRNCYIYQDDPRP